MLSGTAAVVGRQGDKRARQVSESAIFNTAVALLGTNRVPQAQAERMTAAFHLPLAISNNTPALCISSTPISLLSTRASTAGVALHTSP
jgi:hypothetical protein